MPQQGRITHVQFAELPVGDQDRAVAFYTERLGLIVARDVPYQGAWRWLELEVPGARTRILLTRREAASVPGEGAAPALSLIVDDVDAFFGAATTAGVEFTQAPTETPWNAAWRYAMLRDSEGNLVLVQST